MKREEFLDVVKDLFEGKIVVEQLKISDEDAEKLRVDAEDVRAYPAQAWVVVRDGHYRCPQCDHPLGGLSGSFTWGIQHGVGSCSRCGMVQFRYYHYVTERREESSFTTAAYEAEQGHRRRIELFAVCGFSEELAAEEVRSI